MFFIKKQEVLKTAFSLTGFGLTEYQSQALAALFALNRATASELMPLTNVPKARVYGVLDELVEMGAVRKKPARPVVYLVLPPKKALSSIISYWKRKERKRVRSMEELRMELSDQIPYSEPTSSEKGEFLQILAASPASEKETIQLYKTARKRVRILTGVFEYFPSVEKELERACDRGTRVEILFCGSEGLGEKSLGVRDVMVGKAEKIGAVVRFADEVPLRGTIKDHDKAIFSVDVRRRVSSSKDMVLTENENMVSVLNTFFDALWNSKNC